MGVGGEVELLGKECEGKGAGREGFVWEWLVVSVLLVMWLLGCWCCGVCVG